MAKCSSCGKIVGCGCNLSAGKCAVCKAKEKEKDLKESKEIEDLDKLNDEAHELSKKI